MKEEKQVPDLWYYAEKPKLKIPEYGRTVQQMVDHCVTIQDRDRRNRAARAVIDVMGEINPHLRNVPDFQHKLWDQLFIMSDFRLDVDSPFPIPEPATFATRPDRLDYPDRLARYRYYGHNIRSMIRVALSWEDGEKRDALVLSIAKHMKKCYLAWNKDTVEDEVIFEHLKELSDGKLDLTVSKERLTTSATGMDIPRRKFVGPSSAGGATRGRTGNNNPSQMRHYNNNNSRKRPGQGQV